MKTPKQRSIQVGLPVCEVWEMRTGEPRTHRLCTCMTVRERLLGLGDIWSCCRGASCHRLLTSRQAPMNDTMFGWFSLQADRGAAELRATSPPHP